MMDLYDVGNRIQNSCRLFYYIVMLFELKMLEQAMTAIFLDMLHDCLKVYDDDIVVSPVSSTIMWMIWEKSLKAVGITILGCILENVSLV